ncbi:MAG TPA: YfhO family protein [Thermoanaerobaculia bacterium]|nr:YfhO family protein [Thermoanaerobaculia bacterium]
MALLLYLVVTACLSILWSRFVQRVSVGAAIAIVALPLVFTGRAMFTNRVYAPLDLPFTAEPLRDYARDFGVEKPHDIALSDLHCQMIPWQKAVRYALSQGEWPLWNPFILNGDILAAAGQPAVYDPVQWIGFLLPLPDALTFGAAMTFFLAAFFTFAFARASGLKEIAALVAAVAFTFCAMMAFFVAWPLARTWAYLPLILFGVRRLVRDGRPAILAVGFVLAIFAGHPESVLHVVFVGALYGIALRPNVRAMASAIGAGIAALLLTAVYLLPFAEAAPLTLDYKIRNELYAPASYDQIASPDVRRERMAKTFIPFHAPDPSTPGWDPLSARVGVVVMVLAVLALRDRRSWFWVALALLGVLATFGTWPIAHLLHALPLFDIAINERLAFAAAFAMAMLAGITVDRFHPKIGIAIIALVLVERTNEDGGFYPALSKDAFYPRVPLIAAIPRDARMTGVGTALIPNNAALYELEDARGYNAMTYRRLYETYPLWSTYQRAWFNRVDDLSRPFLSFLNVRYALANENVNVPRHWSHKAIDRNTHLLENTSVLPRAFVPPRVRYVRENPVEEMKGVTDFANVAWIETAAIDPQEVLNGPGAVTIERVGLEYHLIATMQRAGWIVISETHWPGWRAYIDGRRVRAHFANHAFVGVHVPEGRHRVRLVYLPESFTRGRAISLATLLLLLILGMGRRRIASGTLASSPAGS